MLMEINLGSDSDREIIQGMQYDTYYSRFSEAKTGMLSQHHLLLTNRLARVTSVILIITNTGFCSGCCNLSSTNMHIYYVYCGNMNALSLNGA